ncbi:MAG TPA: TolC family protein, partial [Bacteroidales bacterium]|nr:TolC family protein [Bacteroidales bacterium]
LGKEVSVLQKEMTTDEVMVKTEELFWGLQSLKEKEKTVISYSVMLDSLYRDVNAFTEAGLAQKNDLLKVQLKQNELKTNLFKLRNGIEMTSRALCQHIGIDYDTMLVFDNSIVEGKNNLNFTNPDEAVKNRTEYQMLEKATEAQKLQKKMTVGEYMPQLAVIGTGFTYDAMEKTSSNAMVMLSLSIPITDWWGGSHKIKRQQIEIEKARNTLEENAELLELQIRQAGKEVNEMQYQIAVSQKSVEQAAESLRVSEDNYKAGMIGISDLLEAQAIYQQSVDELTDAECQLKIKIAHYKQVTGSLD